MTRYRDNGPCAVNDHISTKSPLLGRKLRTGTCQTNRVISFSHTWIFCFWCPSALLPLQQGGFCDRYLCNCKFYLPSQRRMIKCLTINQIEFEFGNVGFWGEGKTRLPGEKPLEAKTLTNSKLNPHFVGEPGSRTRPTLVGGECSHHCAIPAPPHSI